MAISRFNVYSSFDSGSPVLTGLTGSVLPLLDSILVSGYGSGSWFKSGSGWTKPFANASNIGSWQQPSGSRMYLVVNDAGFSAGAASKEAHCTGWEKLENITSKFGNGTGSFPLPNQGTAPTTGSVILRKSNTSDAFVRPWVAYADAWTFYLFTLTGDTTLAYRGLWFGDYSSSLPVSETLKCFIHGDALQNQATGGTTNGMYLDESAGPSVIIPGMWFQRDINRRGASLAGNKGIDQNKTIGSSPNPTVGTVQTPNVTDAALYIGRMHLGNPGSVIFGYRGYLRGVYQLASIIAPFTDGQEFSGSNDYVNRTFQLVSKGSNDGMWLMETSNTVEAN